MQTLKFLAFSCIHCPLQDNAFVDWMLGKIGEHRPDVVVHLGDGREANSASKWPSEYDWTLEDEYESHNTFLASVRKEAGDASLVMLEGNHDDNIRAIGRIDAGLRSLCLPEKHEPELKHWKVLPYTYSQRGIYRIGSVTFGHGYEAGQNADEAQSLLLGMPYGLWIGGHTHRPQHVTQVFKTKAIPLPYWYANAGCGRVMETDYMQRKRQHQWGQGIVVGESQPLKSPRMSKTWDAHLELFRMYE